MCKITKENDSLQRQTENKDENSHVPPIKKNVPELRFPEFKGEWNSYKISEISKTYSGGTPSTSNREFYKGNIPFIKSGEINSETTEQYINEDAISNSSAKYVKKGDLLLALYGATSGEVAISKIDGAINQAVLKIDNKMNNIFQYNYFLKYKNRIVFKYVQGGQGNLSAKIIKNLQFKYPSDEEQKKIANFLTCIDQKIELMEKKHTLYQNIKKYFLDNLFPHEKMDIPNLSFKEYSNIWKQIKLKQIIYKGKAGGTPKSSIKEYYNGNIPFLSINDMTNEGKYITYTEKSITEKGLKNSSAWLVPEKSLLYSMYASVGFVSINNIPLTTSQAIFNIIFKEHVNLEFMYYYLTFYKQYLHRYIETGTQGNLNAKLIKNFKIKIPSKEEQRKIADFLSLIDTYIEINKEKLNHLKQFKKGLLQKMFC